MILRKATYTIALVTLLGLPAAALAQQTTPAPTGAVSFVTKAEPGQYRASQLVGVKIYNAKDENVGNVNDVLVDKKGTVVGVVIGVGGFLGIGEKNVALPYTAITWSDTTPAPAQPAAGAPAPAGTPSPAPGTPETQPVNQVRDYPARGMLAMTKEQLEAAPAFKYASEAVTQ